MDDLPIYKLTSDEIQKFRELLEKAIGYTLEHSDAEVEQMAHNAIDIFWTLRDVARQRYYQSEHADSVSSMS